MSNYVEQKDLYIELVKYVNEFTYYKEDKEHRERPPVNNKLGNMVEEISRNLAKKGNFAGYTWKDDMIQDGCMACLLYMHNYKPEYTNPFGYITSICARAFINHIKKQKKHSIIKDVLANAATEITYTLEENNGTINYEEIRKLLMENEEHA